jgi:Ca-activated chloride channel family protein
MQSDDSDINYLIEQTLIEQEPNENVESEPESFGDKWQEMGPYLLLLILPFAAYSFRRGIVTLVFIGVLLPAYSPEARADWWQDMWKTPDQQAMQAYDKNEYEQAANTFDNDLWQGTAHYKNEDYQAALESFSQVEPTDKSYADATYNAGNALAQLGETDQAIAAYDKVLERLPKHEEALANKALLEKLKEQQEQQQQDQPDEQSKDQENSEQDGEQQDEQQQDGQKNDQEQEGEQSQDPQQGENSEQSESESQDSEQPTQTEQEEQEAEQRQADQNEAKEQESEQEQQSLAQRQAEEELTDEQREQMQRMQNLLNRVPDDPAFLLKRKMQIESQRRKTERLPTNIQGNW